MSWLNWISTYVTIQELKNQSTPREWIEFLKLGILGSRIPDIFSSSKIGVLFTGHFGGK